MSPKHYEEPPKFFSPRGEDSSVIQNKFKSYVTGANSIQKSKQPDITEFNNSTNSGSGNYTNSMVLSPSSHSKPSQTFGKSSATGNSIIENVSNRRYVANVIERDLFRSTFMNAKQDYSSKGGIKEETEETNNVPAYRKFNL